MEKAEHLQEWQREEDDELVAAVSLQGRRPRHSAATDAVSDGSSGYVMSLPSSEPENGFQEHRQGELRNGHKDNNNDVQVFSQETSSMNVYYDKHEENSDVQGSVSEKIPGDDGLVSIMKNFDSQKSQTTIINHQYKENLKDDRFSGFKPLPSGKSFEGHETNKTFSDITVANKSVGDIAVAGDDIELIKESDKESTELDVERVLKTQDTHDLYCPNCNSCITRRVILRKRRRKIQISSEDEKRNRLQSVVASELDGISSHATNDPGRNAVGISLDSDPTPEGDNYHREREPEIFRCLSCFSFFIPTGNDFKLFKIFGDKSEKENIQSPQPTSATKKKWFSSIFVPRKEKTLIDQGSGHKAETEENTVGISKKDVKSPPQYFGAEGIVESTSEPHESGDGTVMSSIDGPKLVGDIIADVGEKSKDVTKKGTEGTELDHAELDTVHQLDSSSASNEMLPNSKIDHPVMQPGGKPPVHTEEPAENAIFKPLQDGLHILVQSSAGSSTPDKSQIDQKLNVAIERKNAEPVSVLEESYISGKEKIMAGLPSENGQDVGAALHTRPLVEDKYVQVKTSGNDVAYSFEAPAITGTNVDIHVEEPLKGDRDALSLAIQDNSLLPDGQVNITKDLKHGPAKSSAGSETIIVVKQEPIEPASSQEAQDITTSAVTGHSPYTESVEAREFHKLDIIKSIVYGGLVESITSVGIVTSAAGANATTINILVLGLANLIGGLFIIGHNLWELKNEHSRDVANQVTEEGAADQVITKRDRYEELLGRREKFWLHATIAVLSFLIFGLLPPVIYGFSFRESDNRDFKLLAVAGASLLGIIILATGKAYVQRPPKAYIKTVMNYVIIGFMAAGVSYAIGDLVKKLLEKLGWFDSGLLLNLPVLETNGAAGIGIV